MNNSFGALQRLSIRKVSHDIQVFHKDLDSDHFQSSFDVLHESNFSAENRCISEVNQLNNKDMDVINILNLQNNSSGTDLDIHNNRNNLIRIIKEINISSGLTKVPKVLFDLKYLTVLNLSNNSLERLPKEIGNLCNLVILKLCGNKLNALPKSLTQVQQLKYLDISSNKFSEVPDVLSYGMRGLNVLDLSCNEITEFSYPLGCLTKLVTLRISNNFLRELPLWIFDNLCQLQVLNISENALNLNTDVVTYCNTGIFESLQVLNVENCNLSYESIYILHLFKNLKILQVGNKKYLNGKRSLDNYMGNFKIDFLKNCTKMKCLYLQNAEIGTLPLDFYCLNNIEILDLSGNLISWLPETFCNLVNLKILDVTSNQLYFLPKSIDRLANLQQIHLGNNNLYQIPESFYNLKNLEFIDLYNNQIENIDPNFLKEKHLKGIDLGLNCLHFDFCEYSIEVDEIRMLYTCLKDTFRKRFSKVDNRCDTQKTKLDYSFGEKGNDSFSNSKCSNSSFEGEIFSDPENTSDDIEKISYPEEENWEEEISVVAEKDEFFDPNEQIRFDQRHDFWSLNFRNNYCPAKYHLPSVRKTYLRNLKLASQNETTEDGQFDTD